MEPTLMQIFCTDVKPRVHEAYMDVTVQASASARMRETVIQLRGSATVPWDGR